MAEVTLTIGDRPFTIACREGEQAHLAQLGERIDREWATANRAAGGLSSERAMLFVALILADQLDEAERAPIPGGGANESALARVAERLERLAEALEKSGPGA